VAKAKDLEESSDSEQVNALLGRCHSLTPQHGGDMSPFMWQEAVLISPSSHLVKRKKMNVSKHIPKFEGTHSAKVIR